MKKIITIFLIASVSLKVSAQLVYKDVAGIFYNRCTSCHHKNQIAHSMMNYYETLPWASAIQADISSGKMPPWPPDTLHKRFIHERILTASEKNKILSWINTGAQKGDTTLAPPAPQYPFKYSLYGKPDLILKVPAFASNATTADAYNCFALPTGLTKDRILRAFEIVPNNPAILHHSVVNVDTTGTVTTNTSGSCFAEPGDFMIGGYVPGFPAVVMPGKAPLKCGIRIKAGSKIITQQHYPAGSVGQIDSTEIRIYFYPEGATGIREVHVATLLQNWLMTIPADAVKTYTAEYPGLFQSLPVAWSIMGLNPHAHHVNVSMYLSAYKPFANDTIPLINIPKWDFNWQGFYSYRNLVKVPAGYKLYGRHVYDNTVNNPNNPNNPPKSVSAGTSTTDEMLFDSFAWLEYKKDDELINIDDIMKDDTLLNPTYLHDIPAEPISSYAYPNPFGEYVTIGYELTHPAKVSVSVYDILGTEVKNISNRFDTPGIFSVIWDGKNNAGEKVPGGIYFYTIRSGKSETSGKIILIHNK